MSIIESICAISNVDVMIFKQILSSYFWRIIQVFQLWHFCSMAYLFLENSQIFSCFCDVSKAFFRVFLECLHGTDVTIMAI